MPFISCAFYTMPAALGREQGAELVERTSRHGGAMRATEFVERMRGHGGGIPVTLMMKSPVATGSSRCMALLMLILKSPSSSISIGSFTGRRPFAWILDGLKLCVRTGAIAERLGLRVPCSAAQSSILRESA